MIILCNITRIEESKYTYSNTIKKMCIVCRDLMEFLLFIVFHTNVLTNRFWTSCHALVHLQTYLDASIILHSRCLLQRRCRVVNTINNIMYRLESICVNAH